MINLDDKKTILKIQGGEEVLKSIDKLPQQLEQAFEESQKVDFPESFAKVENILVCGMGGSRFPALIVKDLFKKELKVPLLINDDYLLPNFVNEKTLLILSSYSGTTEEVITNFYQAKEKKAKITAITSGGEIAKIIKDNHLPGYVFAPIYNPSQQPRIGFGYNVGGLLGILAKLELLKFKKEKIIRAINSLPQLTNNFKVDIPLKDNSAKDLAIKIFNKYPYYIVSEFLTGWGNALANQTNETAKTISTFRVIPELNHHLMEGLKHPGEIKNLLIFVFFFSHLYSPVIQKRFQITKEVVEKNNIKTLWVKLKGENAIEQVFYAMSLGSYLTMYLSVLYQENPSIIPFVDYFKKRLKDTRLDNLI